MQKTQVSTPQRLFSPTVGELRDVGEQSPHAVYRSRAKIEGFHDLSGSGSGFLWLRVQQCSWRVAVHVAVFGSVPLVVVLPEVGVFLFRSLG